MSAIGETDMVQRPFEVKHFQTIHHCSVDVARGLVLLFGIGTKALAWGFFSQEVQAGWHIFFPSSVSLFDLKARFFVPTRSSARPSRAGAVKVGRRANLAACSTLARPHTLTASSTMAPLGAVGMTIRGEPAFGRGSVAPQPCIR